MCALQDSRQAAVSPSSQVSKWWKTLWRLNIPPKVKTFIWRVYSNVVPSMDNLWKKKIVKDPSCPCCGSYVESVAHALFGCKKARKVWSGTVFSSLVLN